MVSFTGTATDLEGDLTSGLTWISNRDSDNPIGMGGSFMTALSWGSHTITATLMGGSGASDLVFVGVFPPDPPTPLGEEFSIEPSVGDQSRPSVAVNADGNFVVTWGNSPSNGLDGDVLARRFDYTGMAQGLEFEVNTYTTSDQKHPSVAGQEDGAFIVVWQSDGSGDMSSDTDVDGFSIQGQRFDSNGEEVGSEFQVNTFTSSDQTYPAVAAGSNGDFVVVWQSMEADDDADGFSVQGQRYDATANRLDEQFQVNSETTGNQTLAKVAADSDGRFFVVWQSENSIRGRSFNSDGEPNGGELALSTDTTDEQRNPTLNSCPDGSFVVAWQSYTSEDVSPWHQLRGERIFRVRGRPSRTLTGPVPADDEFEIASSTSRRLIRPALACNPDGDFVVIWQQEQGEGQKVYDIHGKTFFGLNSQPAPSGPEFQVSDVTSPNSELPGVVFPSRNFLVVWQEDEAARGSDRDLKGQIYESSFPLVPPGPPEPMSIFTDGFESGDTTSWSSTTG